ncbi:MAG: RNA 2'-phosphotransferase [Acidobacteria bacterium]|nr:RNA 2'-phosphotransferase [Acidobacteriota bacterium]
MTRREVKISKFLSLVLRHQPETVGLKLNDAGWVSVADLLAAADRQDLKFSRAELQQVVANNDKQRFSFSADGQLIRANQGHSVAVELGYEPAVPPETLFHGTAERFLASIQAQGLIKGQRHHVHLSADREIARSVGQRYGKPVVLQVHAAQMQHDGFVFYLSTNGVWLTEHVPVPYLVFL